MVTSTPSTSATAADETAGRSSGGLVLVGLALGYFMVLMDTTVVNVALPAIGARFSGSLSTLQWVSNGYTLTFAAFLLTAGTLSDRFGGRRVFLAGLWSFGVLSLVSAFSPTIETLITLRILLGVCGALLLPSSLSVIATMFSDPARRARALGNWAAITGLALVAGPPIGGLLTDLVSWRAIFVINVPIAAVSIAIVRGGARANVAAGDRGLDLAGQVTAVATLSFLTYALVHVGETGRGDSITVVCLAVAAVTAGAFVLLEARQERRGGLPMVPLSLFRTPTFSAALFAGLVVNFGIGGVLFTLSLFFQESRDWSSLVAGLAFLPMTLPTAFNPIFTGRLVARIGPRRPATVGLVLIASGTGLQAAGTGDGAIDVGIGGAALLLLGLGISLALPSLVAGLLTAVPREKAGIASGALNSARQTGAVLGVAVLGAVLATSSDIAEGTRIAMLVSAALMLLAAVVVFTFVGREPRG
jgi:MFS transporter, DHA2 family, methylenomycin A resistance protein